MINRSIKKSVDLPIIHVFHPPTKMPSIHRSIHQLSIHPMIYSSICPFDRPSIPPSFHLPLHLPIRYFIYLHLHPPVYHRFTCKFPSFTINLSFRVCAVHECLCLHTSCARLHQGLLLIRVVGGVLMYSSRPRWHCKTWLIIFLTQLLSQSLSLFSQLFSRPAGQLTC